MNGRLRFMLYSALNFNQSICRATINLVLCILYNIDQYERCRDYEARRLVLVAWEMERSTDCCLRVDFKGLLIDAAASLLLTRLLDSAEGVNCRKRLFLGVFHDDVSGPSSSEVEESKDDVDCLRHIGDATARGLAELVLRS
jgi:hypothetical protein